MNIIPSRWIIIATLLFISHRPACPLQAPILVSTGLDTLFDAISVSYVNNEPAADSIIMFYRVDGNPFRLYQSSPISEKFYFYYRSLKLYGKELTLAAIYTDKAGARSDTSNMLTAITPVLDSVAKAPSLGTNKYIQASGCLEIHFNDRCNYEREFKVFRRKLPENFSIIQTIEHHDDTSAISMRSRIIRDSMVEPLCWYEYRVQMVTGKNETLFSQDSVVYTDKHGINGNLYHVELNSVYPLDMYTGYHWLEIIGDSMYTVQQVDEKDYVAVIDISDPYTPVYRSVFAFDQVPKNLAGTAVDVLCRLGISDNRRENLHLIRAGDFYFAIDSGRVRQYTAVDLKLIGTIADDTLNTYFAGIFSDSVLVVLHDGHYLRRIRFSANGTMTVLDTVNIDIHGFVKSPVLKGRRAHQYYFMHRNVNTPYYHLVDYSFPGRILYYLTNDPDSTNYTAADPIDSITFFGFRTNFNKFINGVYSVDFRSSRSILNNCWTGDNLGNGFIDAVVDTVGKRVVVVSYDKTAIFSYSQDKVGNLSGNLSMDHRNSTISIHKMPDQIRFIINSPNSMYDELTIYNLCGRRIARLHRSSDCFVWKTSGESINSSGYYIYRIKNADKKITGSFMMLR